MRPELLKGNIDLLLLRVLADGPAHGYALIEALRRRSAGAFDLPEGTVYPALHRLERGGLVASRWSEASGRRRRTYWLTAAGERALGERRDEWRRFAGAVGAVLEGAP